MKKLLITVALLSCLLINTAFVFANEAPKNKVKVNKSATDKNITLTVDNYLLSGNGNGLIIYYTVELKKPKVNKDKGFKTTLIDRPDIFIEGKKLNTHTTEFTQKINEHKYRGSVKIPLPHTERSNPFNVKFNIDAILNQEGQWTVDFKVH